MRQGGICSAKYEGVSKMSETSVLDMKAKTTYGTWPRIKQFHICYQTLLYVPDVFVMT